MNSEIKNIKLSIIGLGYVGLPLALEFAKKRKVTGFDIYESRIKELNEGIDKNREFTKEEIQENSSIKFTNEVQDLISSNCYIVTVPTPVDDLKKPDLGALKKASIMVGGILNKGDVDGALHKK